MADTQQLAALIEEVSRLSNTVGDTLALLRKVSDVGAAAVDIAGHNNSPGAHSAMLGGNIRHVLSRDTTIYVRPDGNDHNDGSADTPARALKTIDGVLDLLRRTDQRGYKATVSLAPGNWPGFTVDGRRIPGPVKITSTAPNDPAVFTGQLRGEPFASVEVAGIAFSSNADIDLLRAGTFSEISITGPVNFAGSCRGCFVAYIYGVIRVAGEASVNFNNLSCSRETALSDMAGRMDLTKAIFTGSVAGRRFRVGVHSVLITGNKGPNAIPGTVAGTVDQTGVYK